MVKRIKRKADYIVPLSMNKYSDPLQYRKQEAPVRNIYSAMGTNPNILFHH